MSEHKKGRGGETGPRDTEGANASESSQPSGGSGSTRGLYEVLKNFTLPPIIAVSAAPVLIAWWCWTYELPYMDVMSDLAANALSFAIVVAGFALLVCAVFLGPGLFRLFDDYLIFSVSKMPRCEESEEIRKLRWSIAFNAATICFLAFDIYLFIDLIGPHGDSVDHFPAWIRGGLWATGIAIYCSLIVIRLRTDFKGVGPLCRERATSKTRRSACLYFYRYITGKVPLRADEARGEQGRPAPAGPHLVVVEGDDIPAKTSTAVGKPIGFGSILAIFAVDFVYLVLFLQVAGSLIQTFDQTADENSRKLIDGAMLLLLPIFPALMLASAAVWALVRSRQSITAATLIALALVAFYFPGGPTLMNKMALSLGFGGDRPAQLALLPEAACSHPELFSHTLDCSLTKPFLTDTVLLEWMGPGKAIVRPTGVHRGANTIVFDRKDVSSYEVVSLRK